MSHEDGHEGIFSVRVSRRQVLAGAAAGAAVVLAGTKPVFAAADKEIRIGYVSARSGALGLFGAVDPYVLEVVRKALAGGLKVGADTYRVRILDRDSQSSPARAGQLTSDLITKEHIDLMLSTSAPEVVNPVADACEAAAVPCFVTECPLASFYLGRGGKIGEPSPFKWTFDYGIGMHSFAVAYLSAWSELKTNHKVGVMYPNDADGTAYREHLEPILEKHGYKIVDPGPYEDGTTDYSSQIALFNREDCQIFNNVPLPPDFNAFWRQAAQLHYTNKVIIAQISKTGLFASQITPLGSLAYNLATATYWSPIFPYRSPLTGMTSRQFADGYEQRSSNQWTQQMGPSLTAFEGGIQALKNSGNPTDKVAVRDAIKVLRMTTTMGELDFAKGPFPNTTPCLQIGAQWVKAPATSKWPLDLVTVEHAEDPKVPIQRKLVAYNA